MDGRQRVAYQGTLAISPGVWLYQLTDAGLAAELAVKGTKYFRNDELNRGQTNPGHSALSR